MVGYVFRSKTDTGKFQTDCLCFVRFLASHFITEYLKLPEDPSCLEIDPMRSLDASWWSTVPPKMRLEITRIHTNQKWTPGNRELRKDARENDIGIGLIQILST